MDFLRTFGTPPVKTTKQGKPRRVGVEIEFAAVSAKDGAAIVQDLFGGKILEKDAHRYAVTETEIGEFVVELDTKYAHMSDDDDDGPLAKFQEDFKKLIGDVSSIVVPSEIVCPPVAYDRLSRLEELTTKLIDAGAEGTKSNPLFAFGVQLNPEIATDSAEYLTSMLRAYLLLSPWLRWTMDIDMTRRILAYADPFPDEYIRMVVDSDYRPSRTALIDDYLAANPTRNRELDMLPLFCWIDADRVREEIADERVKARPTFHYRLPDNNIGMPDWSIALEWNRWLLVERLAADDERLTRMAEAFLRWRKHGRTNAWEAICGQFLAMD